MDTGTLAAVPESLELFTGTKADFFSYAVKVIILAMVGNHLFPRVPGKEERSCLLATCFLGVLKYTRGLSGQGFHICRAG